jgi:putative membrane protein
MWKVIWGILATLLVAGVHASEGISTTDFVGQASEASLAQVQAARLAIKKGVAPEVRAFAQRLFVEHRRSNDYLERVARMKGLAMVRELSPARATAIEDLSVLSGEDFDAAFARQMAIEHERALSLFTEGAGLPDPEPADVASWTLARLRERNEALGQLIAAGGQQQIAAQRAR